MPFPLDCPGAGVPTEKAASSDSVALEVRKTLQKFTRPTAVFGLPAMDFTQLVVFVNSVFSNGASRSAISGKVL